MSCQTPRSELADKLGCNLSAAEKILANPQAHVDALVEAGVLKLDPAWNPPKYRVVQPHVHEWRIIAFDPSQGPPVAIGCGCGARGVARDLLPIEVPE